MKSNKGYTLVELVVAVAVLLVVMAELGALMVNSQNLYRNGFYEVSLQENAQQVVQQVQDMLVNATDKVTTEQNEDATVDSDIIVITTKIRDYNESGLPLGTYTTVTYKIGRDVDLIADTEMKGDTGKEYSDLVMTIDDGDPIPIAHGVRSIKLATLESDTGEVDAEGHPIMKSDLTNYLEADMVTVSVEMRNEKYGYTAYSGETFLRNRPGTGGNKISPVPPDNGAQLTVLRYHTYDLKKIVPSGYTHFKWSDGTDSACTSYYTITGTDLACSGLNSQWDKDFDGEILASNKPDDAENQWSDPITISIHTDKVNTDPKIMLNCWLKSDNCANYIPVYGVCTCSSCVKSRYLEAQITLDKIENYSKVVNVTSWDPYEATRQNLACDLVTFKSSADCDIKHTNGTAYAEYDELGELEDVAFATGTTDGDDYYVKMNPKLMVKYWTHNAGHDNGHSSGEINTNYTAISNDETLIDQLNLSYYWGNDKDGMANAFTLTCKGSTSQGVDAYWNNIVDPAVGNGYIRVKLVATYEGGKTFTAYGYLYPQMGGTAAQHNRILDEIAPAGATP